MTHFENCKEALAKFYAYLQEQEQEAIAENSIEANRISVLRFKISGFANSLMYVIDANRKAMPESPISIPKTIKKPKPKKNKKEQGENQVLATSTKIGE